MRNPLLSRVLPSIVLLLSLLGCAQDVDLVDRTQPGALDKRLFTGEWYMRRTVVDAPFTVGFTFVGEADELERVKWEITEDHLIAYRSYDFVAGTDADHSQRRKQGLDALAKGVQGQPVAIYKIVKHFDVQRGYSPATGEQDNVLQENESDRPWYQRGYLRVDWSANLAKAAGFEFTVDTIATEPVQWSITDPEDPDAFTLGFRDGKSATGWRETRDPTEHLKAKDAQYFDFVSKVLAKPEEYSGWDEWGPWSVPVCWIYGNEDCKPAEIAIRTSFLKRDPKDDYEPLEYPDNYLARDDKGALVKVSEEWAEDGQTIYPDPKGQPVRVAMFDKFGYFRAERYGWDDKHGEVESARKLLISRFDLWQQSYGPDGKPLPYPQRKPKPIVYYRSIGFPQELDDAAVQAVTGWDGAFRLTVGQLQGKPASDVPTMFELRRNTFKQDASGKVLDRGQRTGDLRWSLLDYVAKPTRAGLLGYGPSATDPVTGETISASACVYGAGHKTLATFGRDVVRLARGELDPQSYGLGHVTEEEVHKALDLAPGDEPGSPKKKPGEAGKFAQKAKEGPRHPGSQAHAEAMAGAQDFAARVTSRAKQKAVQAMKKKVLEGRDGWAQARMALLDGSPLADLPGLRWIALAFGPPDVRELVAQTAPGAPMPALTAQQRQALLPHNWAPLAARMRQIEKRRLLHKHSITMADFADDAVVGLVQRVKDKDPQQVWQLLFAEIFRSTAEHEIGHTLGLRHNFEGSSDALNYHDDFWDLRGTTGKPLEQPTVDQRQKDIDGMRYSSIMDYAQRFHSDLHGLGKYDVAAIAFGYGQLVEVFAEPPADPLVREQVPLEIALRGMRHYTSIPKVLGGLDRLRQRKWVPYQQVVAENTAQGATADQGRKRTLWEVPYRFCSDEYVQGTPTCNAYDAGADALEIVESGLEQYHTYYLLQSFRRDRVRFEIADYEARVWERYFLPIALQYQTWLFDQWDSDDPWNPGILWDNLRGLDAKERKRLGITDQPWEQAADGGLTMTAAVQRGIQALADVLAQPEPGAYCLDKTTNSFFRYAAEDTDDKGAPLPQCATPQGCDSPQTKCVDLNIALGDGRLYETEYDTATGYYFYERLKNVGSFYDKLAAMSVLTDPTTYFIGVDSSQPLHSYILSMYLYFPKELNGIFGGWAAGRQDAVGWVRDDAGKLAPRQWFDPKAKAQQDGRPVVDVPGMFILRNYAMDFGMAWLNADWDHTFNDSMKVWLEGSGEAFTPAPGAQVATFVNPFNHKVYKAVRLADPDFYSPGYVMVQDAALLAERFAAKDPSVYKWQVEEAAQMIEVARGLYDVWGYAVF